MANFKACVRRKRNDGFYPVYIRVTKGSQVKYIRTDKLATDDTLSKSGEITDPFVMEYVARRIREYGARLNRFDTEHMDIGQIVDILTQADEDVSFTEYAVSHIDRMAAKGQLRTCRNYEMALSSLQRFFGSTEIRFSQLTSVALNAWIKSLETTNRAKEMYPVCIRQVYKAAMLELNDEENDFVRIKHNPWPKVKIPKSDTPEKRAISAEECRRFFGAPLPDSKMKEPLPELGRDVAMMVLCLGGINTVDLYNLKKSDYFGGIIHYRRAKTQKFRADNAYFEMRVPSMVAVLFEKYRTGDDDDFLLCFHDRFRSSDSFGSNANTGIKKICESIGLPGDCRYCVYTFRHTWATTAQNDCGASISEVAFAMNHSGGHKVTRGYIRPDFTPAWELNEKVIDFIFFSDAQSKLGGRPDAADTEDNRNPMFRLSPKMMIRAAAFFKGRRLVDFEDIGYSNVDEVISRLVSELPDDIPNRSVVQFKIVNLDNEKVAMYERMKGKGF